MNIQHDVVLQLRESTRGQHEVIEQLMPIFRPDFTAGEYVRLLETFLGVFEPLEERIRAFENWDAIGVDLPARLRSSLLRRDLRHFGLDKTVIDALPRCTELFSVDSWDAALGVLYVLEGSALGGQVIARKLEAQFGFTNSSGMSFFCSDGRDVGRLWRELCNLLHDHLVNDGAINRATQAATLTFESLIQWLKYSAL